MASTRDQRARRRLLGLPRWAVIVLIVALVAGASYAAFAFLLPGRIPPELVGQWRVVGGQMDGAVFEFHRGGAMIVTMHRDGKEWRMDGTAEVDGTTLRTASVNPITDRKETGEQTIVILTETELVTEDSKGTRVSMVRAR
jgi:uncharacterized protein (TIGR03066 family)